MVILLLQMHRNFQRVEQYNMFSLLLLAPEYRPFCLYTLRLAYLCLGTRSLPLQREEAGIAAGAEETRGTGAAAQATLGSTSPAGATSRDPGGRGSGRRDPGRGSGLSEGGGFGKSRSSHCWLPNISPRCPLQHNF